MPSKTYTVKVDDVKSEVSEGRSSTAFVMDSLFVQWTWGDLGSAAVETVTDEMNYVMEGESHWLVGDDEFHVGAGQILYVPAHVTRRELGGNGRVLTVSGGLPWDRIDLAEHQIRNEYRDWPSINS